MGQHRISIKKSKMDGFYTYFAVNGFSHGSSWKNWRSLSTFAFRNSLIFVPSVGPGYVDTRIRPWNSVNTRERQHGIYYDMAWKSALALAPKLVSVTSFNEWHEGTQIEPAVPKSIFLPPNGTEYSYKNYEPENPEFYLLRTSHWVKKYCKDSDANLGCRKVNIFDQE